MTEVERLTREVEMLRKANVKLRDEAAIGRSVQCALNSIVTSMWVYGGLAKSVEMTVERALDARLKVDNEERRI